MNQTEWNACTDPAAPLWEEEEEEKVTCSPCKGSGVKLDPYGRPTRSLCSSCEGSAQQTRRTPPRWLTSDVKQMAEAVYQSRKVVKCEICEEKGYSFTDDLHGRRRYQCTICHGSGSIPTGHLDPFGVLQLADLLEESGAPDEILDHLRSGEKHVKGCWAVDVCRENSTAQPG